MKPFCWLKFLCLLFGPRFRTDGLNSSYRQKKKKKGVSFLMPCCLGFLFHSGQIKCCTWSALFFLGNRFLYHVPGYRPDRLVGIIVNHGLCHTCHMFQNEASTTDTKVSALTLPIAAAAAANLKESSVDDKSFNAIHVS